MHCTEQDCPARCIPNSESGGEPQCYCPNGYIQDRRNATYICTDIDECENERPCEHTCLNTLGSYECFCDEGYELQEAYRCVSTEEGSGSTPPYHDSTPVAVQPTAVVALLYFVVRNALKRCEYLYPTFSFRPTVPPCWLLGSSKIQGMIGYVMKCCCKPESYLWLWY
uniref:Thrombomodulin n=1 Tax=Myripristis murdjan TaxID=586833 RepID=A0A667YKV0_9TELE